MIVIGLDPGTHIIGYGVVTSSHKGEKPTVIDFGCIITNEGLSAGNRLKEIHANIARLIKKHNPDIVSIESLFFFKNLKTAMPVSQARGVALLAAAQHNVPALEFTPLQIKMAITGYGKATKKQMQGMVKELVDLNNFDLKKMGRKKDDAFDALGAALCGLWIR